MSAEKAGNLVADAVDLGQGDMLVQRQADDALGLLGGHRNVAAKRSKRSLPSEIGVVYSTANVGRCQMAPQRISPSRRDSDRHDIPRDREQHKLWGIFKQPWRSVEVC